MSVESYLQYPEDAQYLDRAVIYLMIIDRYFYVGSTKDFRRRIADHVRPMLRGKHKNRKVRCVYSKHKTVQFAVIEVLPKKCNRNTQEHIEQHYIDMLMADPLCMNSKETAEFGGATFRRAVVVNGVTYPSITAAAAAIGRRPNTVNSWIVGREAVPEKYGIYECRHLDGENKIRRDARFRPVLVDGKKFKSCTEVAKAFGVNKVMVSAWIKGTTPIPPSMPFESIQFEGPHKNRSYRNPIGRPVILNGQRFGTVKEAAKSIGVPQRRLSEWLSGRDAIPLKFPIKSLHYEGQPSRIRVKPQRKPISVDGVVYPTVNDAAAAIGVHPKQVSKWLCKHAPIPKRYDIHSLHYV